MTQVRGYLSVRKVCKLEQDSGNPGMLALSLSVITRRSIRRFNDPLLFHVFEIMKIVRSNSSSTRQICAQMPYSNTGFDGTFLFKWSISDHDFLFIVHVLKSKPCICLLLSHSLANFNCPFNASILKDKTIVFLWKNDTSGLNSPPQPGKAQICHPLGIDDSQISAGCTGRCYCIILHETWAAYWSNSG